MNYPLSICWFRKDLRTIDNPALFEAVKEGRVLPIFILDDINCEEYKYGGASKVWLHSSLKSLNDSLSNALNIYHGNPSDILEEIFSRHSISHIYWNRCYEEWRIERDTNLKTMLEKKGVTVKSFNGSLLWEPWNVSKEDKTPYKVFTPFFKKGCASAESPRLPLPDIANAQFVKDDKSLSVDDLSLLPQVSWDKAITAPWNIGEKGAHTALSTFIKVGISHYKEGRNFPSKKYISRLSPHLAFGEISPHYIWHEIKKLEQTKETEHFCSELGWREFSYSQLFFNPKLPIKNLQSKFDKFPWKESPAHLKAWQTGTTGIPMVDAGMRELYSTGYMHNRVRMIVGSFLVKNLQLHWHHGERWFWDTLFDADLANNSAGWQWVAGCGADAAPYFRIFNPITQGEKFDCDGEYIRTYIPEIREIPTKYIFAPWEAPDDILRQAGVSLGETYPLPIVDVKQSRLDALEAFQSLAKVSP